MTKAISLDNLERFANNLKENSLTLKQNGATLGTYNVTGASTINIPGGGGGSADIKTASVEVVPYHINITEDNLRRLGYTSEQANDLAERSNLKYLEKGRKYVETGFTKLISNALFNDRKEIVVEDGEEVENGPNLIPCMIYNSEYYALIVCLYKNGVMVKHSATKPDPENGRVYFDTEIANDIINGDFDYLVTFTSINTTTEDLDSIKNTDPTTLAPTLFRWSTEIGPKVYTPEQVNAVIDTYIQNNVMGFRGWSTLNFSYKDDGDNYHLVENTYYNTFQPKYSDPLYIDRYSIDLAYLWLEKDVLRRAYDELYIHTNGGTVYTKITDVAPRVMTNVNSPAYDETTVSREKISFESYIYYHYITLDTSLKLYYKTYTSYVSIGLTVGTSGAGSGINFDKNVFYITDNFTSEGYYYDLSLKPCKELDRFSYTGTECNPEIYSVKLLTKIGDADFK